jgi:valyl-tRNA synthetase
LSERQARKEKSTGAAAATPGADVAAATPGADVAAATPGADVAAVTPAAGVAADEGLGPATGAAAVLPAAYHPAEIEPDIYSAWLEADVFAPDGRGSPADQRKPAFVIVQPPPNVTGALHLGHAARVSVEDLMIRRARMQGRPTLWLPGVDHASIAAHLVLDKLIEAEGESRESLGRERYLERMWEFMAETRGVISGQHRRLGASADWSRERFTMDDGSAKAVRTAFKRLYDDGLAYRGEKLINWCPGCRTSLSDLEVIGTPEHGSLWLIRYHLLRDDGEPDPDHTITVATTRPETILGDTAVAVHPDDARYAGLVGRQVLIPFVDRPVPIITDESVDREFGTGAVKITPAHDHTDFETGQRHGLPVIDVMTDDGHMNENAGSYAGLTREAARKKILADLEERGDLVEARPHDLILGRCQRSDDVVEPRLMTQWFIDVKPMAARAMESVRRGHTKILPTRFEKVFFDWMENIRDWNVSRQLWWGHRIPAWYCPDGHVTVSDRAEGPDKCAECGKAAGELRQDDDIFDTWFSSGLWPFSTLGWPDGTQDLARFYPGTVMETAYDILFFWVARMMMLGEWLTGKAPFSIVFLSGLIRDPQGKKMSKSIGYVIDPLGVIDDVGADALRFALVNGSAPGADIRLTPSRLEGSRNFANKLWNATRFVLGARPDSLPENAPLQLPVRSRIGPAEHWILSRAAATTDAVEEAYSSFQFGEAARLLHQAIWSEYCDWYLELAKVQLGADQPPEWRNATWEVLAWVLDRYLRLLHPIMPFITEALWQRMPSRPDDRTQLMVSPWPDRNDGRGEFDEEQATGVAHLIGLIGAIRTARADAGIEPSERLEALLFLADDATRDAYASLSAAVARLAKVRATLVDTRDALEPSSAADPGTAAAAALAVLTDAAEARLTADAATRQRERARLERDHADAVRLRDAARARVADGSFVERAPAAVVEAARQKLAELEERVQRLSHQIGTSD